MSFQYDELPDVLPIFPLTGALLLPGGELPLNVFEPRYCNLLTDVMESGSGMIGLLQPFAPTPDPIPDGVQLYETGCLGELTYCDENDDGSFMVTLTGVCRFRVREEMMERNGYRCVAPDYEPYLSDMDSFRAQTIDRDRLLAALGPYLTAKGIDADWDGIGDSSDGSLVTSLAMNCPLEPREKQALLESPSGKDRADLLTALLEMGYHQRDVGRFGLPN